MPGNGEPNRGRDIILRLRNTGRFPHERISEMHPAYLTLHYVLLYPYGEHGWHRHISHRDIDPPPVNNIHDEEQMEDPEIDNGVEENETNQEHQIYVTPREFYAHTLHQRTIENDKVHVLFLAKDLLQQFIVDAWAQIEQTRLNFIKFN